MVRSNVFHVLQGITLGALLMWLGTSCEGPTGPDGKNGVDANATCRQCHNDGSPYIDQKKAQLALSKHVTGEANADEAGGSTSCTVCHESEAFKYVCANNTPATFTLNSSTNKYVNNYAATTSTGYGEFACNTCHANLHKNGDTTDLFPLTNVAPVAMTMWAGAKTIDLQQDGAKSNLCVKCHQPRPLTTSTTLSDGNVIDYASLASSPTTVFYDSAVGNATPNKLLPSYRMHVHYGGVGAIFAGKGGVEFTGSGYDAYTNSAHTSAASCIDCHMADMTNASGGHTFKAAGNFNGCNVSGCHNASPLSSSASLFTNTRSTMKGLLDQLAAKFTSGGQVFLHSDATSSNPWAGLTTNNYDGYIDIYDPSSNPSGRYRNPAPSGSWTSAQKSANSALPKFTSLTNVQVGALINFQLCLREFSLGIHNTNYTKALLDNSIKALTDAGY